MNAKFIRENPDVVKENQTKRFLDSTIVDTILKVDTEWRNALFSYDQVEKNRKRVQKFIKSAQNGPGEELITPSFNHILNEILAETFDFNNLKYLYKNDIIKLLAMMSEKINEYDTIVKSSVEKRDALILTLGNFLHESVVVESNEDHNPVIRTFNGNIPSAYELKIHYDLCEQYGIVDLSKGSIISGERGYFWKHMGVKLNRALLNYAMDFLENKKYSFIETPHFMQKEQMELVAQLSEFNETLYKIEGQNQYLIATSEQPITASFANTKFKKTDLPYKVCGKSTCYRKEVGSHGKDTRGIFRVHQFEKIEQFCISDKDNSWTEFHEMINTAEEFYKSLGLSYRVVQIVSGGLNNAASMKYDLEGYFPGSDNYKELVSCSNCLDYFSKKIACKDMDKNYLHMLNSTLCANTRTICCILETYQTNDGIIVPDVLRPYMGIDLIKN